MGIIRVHGVLPVGKAALLPVLAGFAVSLLSGEIFHHLRETIFYVMEDDFRTNAQNGCRQLAV